MWRLANRTPYAAGHAFLRDRDGAEILVIAVKATFHLGDSPTLEPSQLPISEGPTFFGDPRASSLRHDCDFALETPATDVIVHATAYSSHGKTVAVETTLKVGTVIEKRVRVIGDRIWERAFGRLVPSEPVPFEQMPIRYERAFGGAEPGKGGARDERNPVGVGIARSAASALGTQLANLEDPSDPITQWNQRPPVAGYGPIARHWSPRREFAGTHDERWQRERHPLPPRDFDARFDQCAPRDQQVVPGLRGGEPIELRNLTPSGILQFELPTVRLGFRTRMNGAVHAHAARLRTVAIEPDERRVVMVWNSTLRCHGHMRSLERTTVYRDTELD